MNTIVFYYLIDILKNHNNKKQSKDETKKQTEGLFNKKSALMNASQNMQCQFNKKSYSVCIQRNCNNYVFLCNDQDCKCRLLHNGCIKAAQKELIMHLEKNIQFNWLIVKKVNQKFDQIVDKFVDMVSKLKQNFEKRFIGQFGSQWLTITQKKIYSKFVNSKPKQLKSRQFYKLLEDKVKNSKFVENKCKQQIEYIEKISSKLQKHILVALKQKQVQLFYRYNIDEINLEQEVQNQILGKSKILKNVQQVQSLKNFFENSTIDKVKLLYQGSIQNFQLSKVTYKNIIQDNVLLLVQTQFNKKIAGFANIQNLKPKINTQQKGNKDKNDKQKKSFLFSLTNKQKITPQTQNCSVLFSQKKGPIFIGDNVIQFQICDQSNVNNLSYVKFAGKNGFGYSHDKYLFNDKKTIQYFTGNAKNSSNFKLKQWEIWQIRLTQ